MWIFCGFVCELFVRLNLSISITKHNQTEIHIKCTRNSHRYFETSRRNPHINSYRNPQENSHTNSHTKSPGKSQKNPPGNPHTNSQKTPKNPQTETRQITSPIKIRRKCKHTPQTNHKPTKIKDRSSQLHLSHCYLGGRTLGFFFERGLTSNFDLWLQA